jgi:shikimate kinase
VCCAGHVLLIGFMGSGKSTVGRLVADRMGRPFVDLDREIESSEGRDIAGIFAEKGEGAFRAAESEAIRSLGSMEPSVVACGGGVVLDEANRAMVKGSGTAVYLQVSAEEALSRIGNTADRPLLSGAGPGAAAELLRSREALYEATADVTVATGHRTPEQVADEVVARLAGEWS